MGMAGGQPARVPSVAELGAAVDGGPTVLRIALGARLRLLREAAGVTPKDAGYAIRASHAKISRLELGRVGSKERDLADLLTLYGVHDEAARRAFLDLARQANTPGWWHRYSEAMPGWFELYVGLEQAATLIRAHEVQFVPGLVQTADFARALITTWSPDLPEEEVERRVDLRLRRQTVLTRPDPLRLWAVVDEAALHRPVGGRQVLRAQLARLAELLDLPNVTVQVLDDRSVGHAAANGPFSILRFAAPDLPDVVYLEQLTSALYLDKRTDVDRYALTMNRLVVEADTPARTQDILAGLLRTL